MSPTATTTRTTRGAHPHSRENMRLAFPELPEEEVRMMLGENAARLYEYDLEALRGGRERGERHAGSRRHSARRDPRGFEVRCVPEGACRAGGRGGLASGRCFASQVSTEIR